MASCSKYKILLIEKDRIFAEAFAALLNAAPNLLCCKHIFELDDLQSGSVPSECDLLLINVELVDWLKEMRAIQSNFICAYRRSDFGENPQQLNRDCIHDFIDGIQEKLAAVTALQLLLKRKNEQILPLWTSTGLELLNLSDVVSFQRELLIPALKPNWVVMLKSGESKALKRSTKAKDILGYLGNRLFIRVNKSTILNLMYLESINYEQRCCRLKTPYNTQTVGLSRRYLTTIRKRFD